MRRALLCVWLLACSSRAGPGGEADEPVPPPPKNLNPPPPLGAEPPPSPQTPGLAWLSDVHARFHERWAEGFLEHARVYLEPGHPLNDRRLRTTVSFTVDAAGRLRDVAIRQSSGNREFDEAALEVVRDSAPLSPPPPELRSDEGGWHLEWSFHRDQRQDAIALAKVDRRTWEPARAIPMLLGKGQVDEAARRVSEAAEAGGHDPALLALAGDVARAALLSALADARDGQARVEAARALGALGARAAPVLPHLRRLAREAPDLAVQRAILAALGRLRDRSSLPLLLEAVATVDGERSVAAAEALARLGERTAGWRAVGRHLEETDGRTRQAVLATLEALGAPESRASLTTLLANRALPRAERASAARALGGIAAADKGGEAARALAAALVDGDAAVRAAAARGLARAGEGGLVSRPLRQKVAPLLKDRDPEVRAAAVAAVAALGPGAPPTELLALAKRETDGQVLAAIAPSLGGAGGVEARRALERLAAAPLEEVRVAAVRALAHRPEAEARAAAAALTSDASPEVRAAAYEAQTDVARASAGLTDEAPEVRAGVVRALVRLAGPMGAAAATFRLLALAKTSRERALVAGAWLEASGAER